MWRAAGRKAALSLALLGTSLSPIAAQAHTDSLGFLIFEGDTSGFYNVQIFYGSWHPNMTVPEGSLDLSTADGTLVGNQTFVLVDGFTNVTPGTMPTGLVEGTNYFYANTATPEGGDLTGDPSGHSIYAFQSVIFKDLAAGSYKFGYAAGSSFSQNWMPSDSAINNGSFVINADGSLGSVGGATPSTPDIDTAVAAYTTSQLAAGSVNPVFAGGVLAADSDTTVANDFTFANAGGTIDTQGHDTVFTGVLSDASGASGGLTKAGAGTLTLTGANTYTGGTTVLEGTLKGDTTSLQGAIANNAAVEFAQASDGTYGGVVSGSGKLVKSGAGTLTLTGANTYTGGTDVQAGTLKGDTTSLRGAIANNATVEFAQASDGTYAGAMSGNGKLVKSGKGTLTLSGANTYAGGTNVQAGTLKGDATSLRGAIANSATVEFAQGTNGIYGGAMSGSGKLVKSGAGTLTLSGANTHTGGTDVQAGTLRVSSDGNLGAGAVTIGAATLQTTADLSGKKSVVLAHANSTIDTGAHAVELAGTVSGKGTLNKTGTGTLRLTGVNTQNGVFVRGGTLEFNSDAALGAAGSTVTIAENTTLRTLDTFTIEHTLQVNNTQQAAFDTNGHDIVMAGNITGAGIVRKLGEGTLTLTGKNTQVLIDVHGGRVVAVSQEAVGVTGGDIVLRENGGFTAGGDMTLTQNLHVTGNNAVFDTGAFDVELSGTADGSACLVKQGSGRLNMTAAGSNAIGACVQEGTLSFNNQFDGNVWVDPTGTAGGAGRIVGNMEVAGILAPGNSPGQLIVAGSVTQSAGSQLQLDIDGKTAGTGAGHHDTLVLTGADSVFTAGGSIVPITRGITGDASNEFTPAIGDTFQVVVAEGGVEGSFDALVQPTEGLAANTRFDVLYTPDSVVLTVTADKYAKLFNGSAWGNGASLAGAVDRFRGAAGVRNTGASGRFLEGLMGLNAAQAAAALQQAAGEVHADSLDTALQASRTARSAVSDRVNSRFDLGHLAGDNGVSMGRKVWGTISSDVGRFAGGDVADRYRASTTSMVVGIDDALTPHLTVGAAFAYNRSRTQAYWLGSAKIDGYQALAYGQWQHSGYYVNAIASYGYDSYKVDRTVSLANGDYSLKSSPDGTNFAGDIEFGKLVTKGNLYLTPFAGVGYDNVTRDGLVESGDAAVALTFDDERRQSLVGRVGARFSGVTTVGKVRLMPYGSFAVLHELDDAAADMTAILHRTGYRIEATSAGRGAIRAAAGLSADLTEAANLRVGYKYTDAQNAHNHAVSGTLSVRW